MGAEDLDEYYDPLLESIIEQVTDPDSPLNAEELLGVTTAPPTPESGGPMLAMEPVPDSGEGSKEERRLDGYSSQESPVCIPTMILFCVF